MPRPRCLGDAVAGREFADHLAEAAVAVDDRERIGLDDDRRARVGHEPALPHPVEVLADADHAMRIVADEVGVDEPARDRLRLRLRAEPPAAMIAATRRTSRSAAIVRISGSPAPAVGAVPSRKSKSQPSFACVMCAWYSAPKPRSNCGAGRFHAALRRASSASSPRASSVRAGDVERDDVAVAHERERTADERLGRHVQHARAVARAAHARIGDAQHVAHAFARGASSGSAAVPIRACPARRADRRS